MLEKRINPRRNLWRPPDIASYKRTIPLGIKLQIDSTAIHNSLLYTDSFYSGIYWTSFYDLMGLRLTPSQVTIPWELTLFNRYKMKCPSSFLLLYNCPGKNLLVTDTHTVRRENPSTFIHMLNFHSVLWVILMLSLYLTCWSIPISCYSRE